jgi:ribonuclease VapC
MISACRDDRHRPSTLVAILNHEPDRAAFYEAIAAADRCLVSAVTYQEAGHVIIAKRGVNGLHDLEDFLALIKAEIIPHDIRLAAFALEAFRRYGKASIPKRGSIFAIAPLTLLPRR